MRVTWPLRFGRDGWSLDLDGLLSVLTPETRLLYLNSPNNPTGTVVGHDELRAFLAQVPERILVVIDEAYVHFQDDPNAARGIDLFREFENVAVLHTFSKAYGLAGLRVGFGIAQPALTDLLNRIRQPFNVNSLAQAAAAKNPKLAEFIAEVKRIGTAQDVAEAVVYLTGAGASYVTGQALVVDGGLSDHMLTMIPGRPGK